MSERVPVGLCTHEFVYLSVHVYVCVFVYVCGFACLYVCVN